MSAQKKRETATPLGMDTRSAAPPGKEGRSIVSEFSGSQIFLLPLHPKYSSHFDGSKKPETETPSRTGSIRIEAADGTPVPLDMPTSAFAQQHNVTQGLLGLRRHPLVLEVGVLDDLGDGREGS